MSKKYSPQEFVRALGEGTLDRVVRITGMAKWDGKDPLSLMFAAGDCEKWVAIPLDAIEHVDMLGQATCKDHTHPRVRIELKAPQSPEAALMGSLLNAQLSVQEPSAFRRRPGRGACQKFCSQCNPNKNPDSQACRICSLCGMEEEE